MPMQDSGKLSVVADKAERAVDWVENGVRLGWELAPKLFGAVVILVLAWMVSSWARRAIYRALNRPHFDQTLIRFFSTSARWVVMVIALVAVLGVLGIPTASVLTAIGAAGLAIGLALQGSLSNLAAGIMLLIQRPFKVGDVITVAGVTGKVDEIELFSTKVDTPENKRVILPNGQVFGNLIDNATHHATRQVIVTIGVDYAADIDRTRAVLQRAVEVVPSRLANSAATVVLSALSASSVDWQVGIWCATADVAAVRQSLLRACKIALDEAGIGIPFPQMEVWARQYREPLPLPASQRSRLADSSPSLSGGDPE